MPICIAATRPDTARLSGRSIVSELYRDWKLVVVTKRKPSDSITATVKESLGGRRGILDREHRRGVSRARNATIAAAERHEIAIAPWIRGRRAGGLAQATACLA